MRDEDSGVRDGITEAHGGGLRRHGLRRPEILTRIA
jgi:hypothetical protein